MVKLMINPLGDVQASTSSIKRLPKKGDLLIVHDTAIAAMDLEQLRGRRLLFRRCVFGPSCQRALDAIAVLNFRCEDCRGLDIDQLALSARGS